MAEAFLRQFAGDFIEVASAGTIAADRPDPGVVAAMAEDGIDISTARPKLLDPSIVAKADRVITMGCDVEGVPRIDADWGLPDPKGQSAERVLEIQLIEAQIPRRDIDLTTRRAKINVAACSEDLEDGDLGKPSASSRYFSRVGAIKSAFVQIFRGCLPTRPERPLRRFSGAISEWREARINTSRDDRASKAVALASYAHHPA